MPVYDVRIDSENKTVSFVKDGKAVENLEDFVISFFKDFDDNFRYHTSYVTIENGEEVMRSVNFVVKDHEVVSGSTEEVKGGRSIAKHLSKILKNKEAADRLAALFTEAPKHPGKMKKDKDKDNKKKKNKKNEHK